MNHLSRTNALTPLFAALLTGIAFAHAFVMPVLAQAPTPEQLELLRSLPPEEQQVLIEKAQESLTGTAPLVGVGENTQQRSGMQDERSSDSGRPIRDKDGDGIEDPPEPPKSPAELKPFGYDIFRRQGGDFEPEAAIPVPNDYVLGPGDRLEVQLYGNERGNYVLIVGRDGQVRFPKIGPVSIGGMRFADVRELITERISTQFVGTEVSISMGELRSIRVFVLGDVERPGSYLVSALSTISNTLLAAGGVSMTGSLRTVQLKRSGNVVSVLDLYDLLLNGDTSRDVRLLAGDVVFVPPVGTTVSVFGEVNRPAIYEVKPGTSIGDLLTLSGGLRPKADPKYARIERVSSNQELVTVDVDLSIPSDRMRKVESGDLLTIAGIRPTLQGSIELAGAVHRPRAFEHASGLHLSDVISSLDELRADGDAGYVLIRREPELGQVEYYSADLRAALAAPKGPADIALQQRDRIFVLPQPDAQPPSERTEILKPLIDDLRGRATIDSPSRIVTVAGVIRAPGDYPLETDMTVRDLLRAGGQPGDAAYPLSAELTRYAVIDGERRQTEVVAVDMAAVLAGVASADLPLQAFDVLTIKQVPEWTDSEFVTLTGEFRFPGRYPIRRGETMRSVIERAGGISSQAFLEGAVFTRALLREREKQQLEQLATRLQSDLAFLALRNMQSPEKAVDSEQALAVGRTLLADLRAAEPVGRLVVNLAEILNGAAPDVELRDGDTLAVPRPLQSVTVLGEVQSPTSHLWRSGVSRDEYINLSGGLAPKADKKRIYVVRADGSVVAQGSGFFGRNASAIRPGDTVVVPLNAESVRPLTLWTSVTQIIFNLAVAVAAVNSF